MDFVKPRKIFIVDDDPMLLEAFKDYLTAKAPHQVSAFLTGEECLKHLAEKPDVIILDHYLNTVQKDAANGMEILQIIKKNYPHAHVIMLSSQERYAVALQSIQKGAEHYVIKDKDSFKKIEEMINALD